ncbi:hypothetical protein [Lactobacillus mulieris]|uniref:hypothetical protein n=1 Tax=Lactobacillus mulieris TaxID=2508708 RepID=UPI0001B2AF2E|nr:hypothetical protein [Lactobacillus mulieris]EEU21632.1 hypothetical protein HMPREF0525_00566 [Lactobacillus jensenii 27-2-CHN]EEX24503.1 hypothetical protein HMPREF0974_00308 [Lactobacillus jensenii 115-3-CHN]MCW8093513.1 hypothetical protein [Lactobacillus mulieris]MCZ3876660.1 hypothetical protein [Lactobacillus mulieris]MCZ3900085.1 hypothetical protein [Lactobacillus mulieris]
MHMLHYPDSKGYTFDGVRLYTENFGLIYEAKKIDESIVIKLVSDLFKAESFEWRSPYHYTINKRPIVVREVDNGLNVWANEKFVKRIKV